VETSFLPDREREAEEQAERERLRKQWLSEQERIRNEPLEITYSYWDGAGHRRVLQVFLDFKILLLYFPALLALILSQISLGLEWNWCPDLSSISLSLGCLGWFAGQERRLHS
jgi:hypothetical protein